MPGITDPVWLEVFRNELEGVADAMALILARTARSSIVRVAMHFSTGLLGPSGELISQGLCHPVNLGGMQPALTPCLERYQDRVYPGDIFINNDPYHGGSHLPDLFLFKPVFAEGTLLGYACTECHHTDIGGLVPGSVTCNSTEIYQEGLRIPPLKLYEKGVPNETLFRIIEKAVRVPDKVLGDIAGQVAALDFGTEQFLRLANQYGTEGFLEAEREVLDHTERLTRQAIGALPNGQWSFTDYVDDDGFDPGPIPIVATITKNDDRLHIDFSGTGPQCKGAIQPPFSVTGAMVYAAVKSVLGGEIPNTGGYYRPVTVTAPEGSFVNPVSPAPVSAMGIGIFRLVEAVFGAFAQMLPDRIPACIGGCEFLCSTAGYDRTTTPWKAWVFIDSINDVAVGGYPYRDGMDAQASPIANPCNTPAEIIEVEYPLMIEEYALLADMEGAGKFRGGVGLVRQYRMLQDNTLVQVRTDRVKHPPYGLCGGQSAPSPRITLNPGRTDGRAMPPKFVTTLKQGEVVRVDNPGAGGWGDPLDRDPQLVLQDAIAEKVTPQRAQAVYGVVLDMEHRAVDARATEQLRKDLSHRRPPAQSAEVATI